MQKKLGDKTRIAFYGDDMWEEAFGAYFTRHQAWSGLDISNVDKVDNNLISYVTDEMEKGSDFDLLLLHMFGMDSAGHTHGSKHPEVERKLLDTEKFIK